MIRWASESTREMREDMYCNPRYTVGETTNVPALLYLSWNGTAGLTPLLAILDFHCTEDLISFRFCQLQGFYRDLRVITMWPLCVLEYSDKTWIYQYKLKIISRELKLKIHFTNVEGFPYLSRIKYTKLH